jgi:hypothetical protein
VPPQETTRTLASGPVQTFILIVFVVLLMGFAGARSSADLRGSDFPDFYAAARMVADGHGHQLYDADVQRQYQARNTGRAGTLYIHPPFEAVLYLAVAWLSLKYAYLLWSVLNLVLLAASAHLLASKVLQPWNWRLLLAASLTFVPLELCIQQGQDSLSLLLLIVLAYTALRRKRALAAGCWLGLGLFKFQVVLPMLVVLLVTSERSTRKDMAKGFGLVMVALGAASAVISGWSVLRDYPLFLLHLQGQPFAGIFPQAMANLRGLVYVIFHNDQSTRAIMVLSICCALALFITLIGWNNLLHGVEEDAAANGSDNFDRAFASSVLFALLVSYHLNPHDLTVLLLPLALIVNRVVRRRWRPSGWLTAGVVGILFLPPLHLWALRAKAYALISVPLLALFMINAFSARKSNESRVG